MAWIVEIIQVCNDQSGATGRADGVLLRGWWPAHGTPMEIHHRVTLTFDSPGTVDVLLEAGFTPPAGFPFRPVGAVPRIERDQLGTNQVAVPFGVIELHTR